MGMGTSSHSDAPAPEQAPALRSRRWVLLPWVLSIGLHLVLIVLTVFLFWSSAAVEEEKKIVPVARLAEAPGAELVELEAPALLDDPAPLEPRIEEPTPSLSSLEALPQPAAAPPLPGLPSSMSKLPPIGSRLSRGGLTPQARFYGTGGNARTVVYVVDASGSLIGLMQPVTRELLRSVHELSGRQSFTVLFFQGERVIEMPPAGLKAASADNHRQAERWIASRPPTPQGASNPVAALRQALSYQPDLIFLLSDNMTGSGQSGVDQAQLLALLDRLNPQRRTAINAIEFGQNDPEGTLARIARIHGGQYRGVADPAPTTRRVEDPLATQPMIKE